MSAMKDVSGWYEEQLGGDPFERDDRKPSLLYCSLISREVSVDD